MTTEKDRTATGWNFDNSYSLLPKSFYRQVNPSPVQSPKLVMLNSFLAESLGLNPHALQKTDGVAVLSGNWFPEGSAPLAQAYAGHQFGHFTMLGDGRAILLGEQITPRGERFDIQLKGSGRTPYSRQGDGRAALGPMLREYIISEAMHALGIPTTRSLAVVTTGEAVFRENALPGAILTRTAASHLRVGTFQYAAEFGTVEDVRILADYTLNRHFQADANDENKYLRLLQAVIHRQALLIAKWQLIGFVHGVMNTDNMTLCGETIDYGPCAFMDTFNQATVFSSIDTQGRYAYGNQPRIAAWNLTRFAETLVPLVHSEQAQAVKLAQEALAKFDELYHGHWLAGMRSKIGLFNAEEADESLVRSLLGLMQEHTADYTNTFLALTFSHKGDSSLFDTADFLSWNERWQARLARQQEPESASHHLMRGSNPALIPRNHRVEEALAAAVINEDYSVTTRFLDALASPYAHSANQAKYALPPANSNLPYRTYCGT